MFETRTVLQNPKCIFRIHIVQIKLHERVEMAYLPDVICGS